MTGIEPAIARPQIESLTKLGHTLLFQPINNLFVFPNRLCVGQTLFHRWSQISPNHLDSLGEIRNTPITAAATTRNVTTFGATNPRAATMPTPSPTSSELHLTL